MVLHLGLPHVLPEGARNRVDKGHPGLSKGGHPSGGNQGGAGAGAGAGAGTAGGKQVAQNGKGGKGGKGDHDGKAAGKGGGEKGGRGGNGVAVGVIGERHAASVSGRPGGGGESLKATLALVRGNTYFRHVCFFEVGCQVGTVLACASVPARVVAPAPRQSGSECSSAQQCSSVRPRGPRF